MDPSISRFIFAQNIVFFFVANRCVYISFMDTLHICLTYYRDFFFLLGWRLQNVGCLGRVCVSSPSLPILDKELDSETQLNQQPYANIYKCGYIS